MPPLAAMPIVTVPLTVAPAAGLVNDAVRGCGPFCTVIVLAAEPVLPAASRTVAVRVCEPLGTVVVSQGIDTGPVLLVVCVPTVWVPTVSV